MAFDSTVITEKAQERFNLDMQQCHYTSEDFQLYNSEAGWQDWMEEYKSTHGGVPATDAEINNILTVRRKMWDRFWQEAAKVIKEEERNHNGKFVYHCRITNKPKAYDIGTFEFDGDTYEYDLGSFNGEHYAGWNTRTKEYCKIYNIALEIEENEYARLGIILSKI